MNITMNETNEKEACGIASENMKVLDILVLGEGNVGKTEFQNLFNYVKLNNGETVLFNMTLGWSTGQFDSSNFDGTIIMFSHDSLSSYNSAVEMLSQVKGPRVLVGNKYDMKNKVSDDLYESIRSHMTEHQIAYYDISCKSYYNYDKPLLHLCRTILNDKDLMFQ